MNKAILNRKAGYKYRLKGDRFEAGLVLSGAEAKAVREGHADLTGATVRLIKGEAYLLAAKIYSANIAQSQIERTRKLLLHCQELLKLATKIAQQQLTLVPVSLYTKGRFIKLSLRLGKTKRKTDKREKLFKKEFSRGRTALDGEVL